jgi:hypothetical protein
MARKAKRVAKKAKTKRTAKARTRAGHVFALKLRDVPLNQEQVHELASQLRDVTTRELLRMDFRIEELTSRSRPDIASSCGSTCSGCS